MVLTGISAVTVALADPPFLSFHIERKVDIAALALQSLAGVLIASTSRGKARQYAESSDFEPRRQLERTYSLLAVAQRVVKCDPDLQHTVIDLQASGCTGEQVGLSESDLQRILFDVIRSSISYGHAHRISLSIGRRPENDQIVIITEPDTAPELRRLYAIGRPDSHCDPLPVDNWPKGCSATWFNNGHARIYQISIQKGP